MSERCLSYDCAKARAVYESPRIGVAHLSKRPRLERISLGLNREDSQGFVDERV